MERSDAPPSRLREARGASPGGTGRARKGVEEGAGQCTRDGSEALPGFWQEELDKGRQPNKLRWEEGLSHTPREINRAKL